MGFGRGVENGDKGTFNFQKASCTLDASVKIYSYRVDDTYTSSYKILENLNRNRNDKGQKQCWNGFLLITVFKCFLLVADGNPSVQGDNTEKAVSKKVSFVLCFGAL